MLRVTVELLPGGSKARGKHIAIADIGRIRGGRLGTYSVTLRESPFGSIVGELKEYPRHGTTIWDLIARGIAVTLTGRERLPKRPTVPSPPLRQQDSLQYIRLSENS